MKKLLVSFGLVLSFLVNGQTYYPFTSLANRKKHDENLINSTILSSLKQPLTSATEGKWMGAFWAMELALYKTPFTKEKITQAWKKINTQSEDFQKALLEVSYTLYPNAFDGEALALLRTTPSPAIFIRSAEYLLLSNNAASYKRQLLPLVRQKAAESNFTGYAVLLNRLQAKGKQRLPPVNDLFNKNFLSGQTVIFSLQRSNRNYAGLVIIRRADGSLVRDNNGEVFQASQLARAITNYPFYITNGNTPQGIFRWTGFDTSSITYIGPTPNLQMVMPFESTPAVFFGDSLITTKTWDKPSYASLLPSSWKAYEGIYESFLAGQMGRSEIIMHGTTINPSYYKGKSYFPQTPSLGCLCSYEEWNNEGKRIASEQQRIVDALKNVAATSGYVVVIDIDDKKAPVTWQDVLFLLNQQSESSFLRRN